MKGNQQVIDWLLQGDPAIRWQVMRDLVGASDNKVQQEQKNVAMKGWGHRLLALQDSTGIWGGGLYGPKWISTTYTLLLLRRLGLEPFHSQALKGCQLLLDKGFYGDGGINFFPSYQHSETCVTGMVLSLLAYFGSTDGRIERSVEHLFNQQMPDGGWNCDSYKGATHSSFHTTICVLEGLREFEKRYPENGSLVAESQIKAREFLLVHRLFRSHRNGKIVDPKMTRLSFPPRWHYDIMRALDYFRECHAQPDPRMEDAVIIIRQKHGTDGRWKLQQRYPGRNYFEMEKVGQPSRWNTLRALRILKWHKQEAREE
jgi:hypothetical protein